MYKKILSLIMILVMVLSLSLTGCGKDKETADDTYDNTQEETTDDVEETEDEAEDEAEEEEEEVVEEINFAVGVVTDTGGIDDKSFNQGTWEGVVRFAEETGADHQYLQSESDADYVPNLSAFADEEYDLIVAPGFLFEESMGQVSDNFPEQNFLIIDTVVGDRPNVASAVFAEHEGSFLVGVAAALKAQEAEKDTVGFLGGMDFGLIQKFEAGFEAGVHAVDENMTVLVEYAGSFSDTQIGQTKAAYMYGEGAYIIYHAAGGCGNGLIKEAKDRRANGEDVWAIGVDKDQYEDGIYEGEQSAILTSMVKRVDVAAYDVAQQTLAGNFPGGEVLTFTLSNEGVGIPENNPNLSDEIVAEVKSYEEQIIAGDIVVSPVPSRLAE